MNLLFVIELPFDSLTGGSLYERNVTERLRDRGHRVTLWQVAQGRPPRELLGDADVVLWDGMSLITARARWGGLLPGRPQAAIVHSPFAEPFNNREPWLAAAVGEAATSRLAALERELFASVDAILVPSRKIGELLAASYGADPRRVSVHPPTAHLPVALIPARNPPGDRWAFVSLGSVTARKNQLVLLEALAAVRPALFAGRPWSLRLAGRIDAEPAYGARIAAAARALGLEGRVAWGPASPAEMLKLVAGCHLALFPSHDEGFGMAVYETSCAGVPTAFVEGNCALGGEARSLPPVRSSADAGDWTEAIEAYLGEPDRWEALAAAGRRTPRSWDQVAAGIEGVLYSLARGDTGAAAQERAVRRYYDPGARLSALGRREAPLPIHRKIRAPGVRSRRGALGYAHRRIVVIAREHGCRGVLDLGCGHGALLLDLQARMPGLALAGLTISGRQARIARSWLGGGVAVSVSSYLRPESYPPLPAPRLLTAIESFVHSADRRAFVEATAAYARAGDRMVICDDFLAPGVGDARARSARVLRAFRAGWRAPSACTAALLAHLAADAGWRLASDEDWTPFVPTAGRLLLLVSRALLGLPLGFSRLAVIGNRVGGAALVVGYRLGLFRYRCLLFERS